MRGRRLRSSEPLMTTFAAAGRAALASAENPTWSERLLVLVEHSHRRAAAVLLVLSLVCFLPGFVSLQPMDRDEPRFAQASKQMLESGDFVDIRFQDEARHKKPVGIYWLQSVVVAAAEAAGVAEARTTVALYRIPSLIGALAAVLLTYWAALAFVSRRQAFLAAGMVAASIILMVEARLAKTDAMLLACCIAAMGALARAYFARGSAQLPPSTSLVFWTAFALGILIKGPLVIMFTGLCAFVLSIRHRSARWLIALRPALGVALVLVLVAPWFIAISIKSGGAFYAEAVGHDMLGKVGTAQTYHWAPPGFYLLAFFATFWPAAALATIAIPYAWANRSEDAIAFALAWVVPAWLVFEAVPTKLPHYVMPLYPAIAIVTVMAMARGFVGPHRPGARWVAALIPFIPAGLAVLMTAAAWSLDGTLPYVALPVLLAACVLAGLAWRIFVKGEVGRAAVTAIAASAVLSIGVFGLTAPVLRSLKLSPRLAEVARMLDCPDPAVGTLGYREPSLVFLVGTDLQMLPDGRGAAEFLKGGTCRLVFVERRFEEAFRAEAARLGTQPALSTRISGFNINGGRRLDIGAYVIRPNAG
jgi:4-amino-4-deoxy-L-arabinose transferase-like glycosyltransferase